jgi:2-C-methyl-D-erythritol 2,4-cyclodiphosphate synthase
MTWVGFDFIRLKAAGSRRRTVLARGLDTRCDARRAVGEALLCPGLGDLGRHFPDTDPRYRGISSLLLLREVAGLVVAKGGRVVNVDGTVVAQTPRLAPYLPDMAARLAGALALPVDAVSVKAKSPEGLGLLGRREGIAAMAVVGVEVGG